MELNKVAIVIDTNFILENKKIDDIIQRISPNYILYIPQFVINERIAHQQKELRNKIEKIEDFSKKNDAIIEVKYIIAEDKELQKIKKGVQKKYESLKNCEIIPFTPSIDMFNEVINRALDKTPPFSSAENASDKGMKDCLVWLSMLEYFKNNGENDVVFLSNDNAFLNEKNNIFLSNEFREKTNKNINFKENKYFSSLKIQEGKEDIKREDNFQNYRDQIYNVLHYICTHIVFDQWGNEIEVENFNLCKEMNIDNAKNFLENLNDNIEKYLFEKHVQLSWFVGDDLVINHHKVELQYLEQLQKIYVDIKNKYSQFLDSFYSTIVNRFNECVEEYDEEYDGDIELPF